MISRLIFICTMALYACASHLDSCQHGLSQEGGACSSTFNSANKARETLETDGDSQFWLTKWMSSGMKYINNIQRYLSGAPNEKPSYSSMYDGLSEDKVNELFAQAKDFAAEIRKQRKATPNMDIDAFLSGTFQSGKRNVESGVKAQKEDEAKSLMDQVEMFANSVHGHNAQVKSFLENMKDIFDDSETIETKEDAFPPSTRRHPGHVGDVVALHLSNGETRDMVTLSVHPPLFAIDNFLTTEECDYIIEKSLARGLHQVGTFKDKKTIENKENYGEERISEACHLSEQDLGKEFTKNLHEKVSRLADVPTWVVAASEPLDIKWYKPGGHYHAHLDSNEASKQLPCCFQQECLNDEGKDSMNADCCKCCRYATALYYLNDVEEGGETVFPLADLTFKQIDERSQAFNWRNLTTNCHDAEIIVKPKKGKAVFWYNNLLDKHGYLSGVDKRSFHGGCDVRKGEKWIATNWIAAPNYSQRFRKSKFLDRYTYLKD